QQVGYRLLVADVAVYEADAVFVSQGLDIVAVAGIGQRVQHHYPGSGISRQPVVDKVAANETGGAGDQHVLHRDLILERTRPPASVTNIRGWLPAAIIRFSSAPAPAPAPPARDWRPCPGPARWTACRARCRPVAVQAWDRRWSQ